MFNRDYVGKCDITTIDFEGNKETSKRYLKESDLDVFIRYKSLIAIWNKVKSKKNEFLDTIVSSRNPYGFTTDVMNNSEKKESSIFSFTKTPDSYVILGLGKNQKRLRMYFPKNHSLAKFKKTKAFEKYKIFIAKAYGVGAIGETMSSPILAEPEECCTETFLEIGGFDTEKEAENLIKYIRTKFFRALVGIQKQTQNTTQKTFRFVPVLDFRTNNEINWELSVPKIDEQLYKMFELSDEEIKFIEEKISEME